MARPERPGEHEITWSVQRRGKGWVAVVYLGESPVTFNPPISKSEARVLARKRANEFRAIAGTRRAS